MSRVGRKPVVLPKGVSLSQKPGQFSVKGPKGELSKPMPGGVALKVEGDKVVVTRVDDSRENRAKHGLVRAHLANMVKGVSEGWTRELEINGVGYRAEVTGDSVTLALGFSHPIVFPLPKSVTAKVEKNRLTLVSPDKDVLGQVSAKLRELRPPEPYKGKGIKYVEEVIKRKVGKAAATGAAT
ncbi:MAG: 50S ribosomal protein L6 [Deltaproteobacteria bacterium]|jgi:large subunit ribosomal protein L6|nr:50S ribosomal protein L6 [Deltaproteobacteria bacterium]